MSTSLAGEQTPLLSNASTRRSSIPWSQFSIALWIQLVEPLSTQVIAPFAPQLIRDIGITHGDETKVGYYVGILHSVFYMAQVLTGLFWSKMSDHVGRKPVLLTGLFGVSLSMICFGSSKTFLGLVLSRVVYSALNANVGVIKGFIAELSGENLPQMVAYIPITWAIGGTLGPYTGGLLAHPAEQFPAVFGNDFWRTYPYLLPCAVPAIVAALCSVITYLFLKETVQHPRPLRSWWTQSKCDGASPDHDPSADREPLLSDAERPKSLRELLTRKVLITATNYGLLALIDSALRTLQPVIYSTPISLGGLGLTPLSIGKIQSAIGFLNGLFQLFFFAKIHNFLGSRRTFILGLCLTLPVIVAFPVMNYVARTQGIGPLLWFVLALQVLFTPGIALSFGAALVLISASSPNKASLGATNGLCQMAISLTRSIGPALFNSLFAFSLEHRFMSGYFVYYLLTFVLSGSIVSSIFLPDITAFRIQN